MGAAALDPDVVHDHCGNCENATARFTWKRPVEPGRGIGFAKANGSAWLSMTRHGSAWLGMTQHDPGAATAGGHTERMPCHPALTGGATRGNFATNDRKSKAIEDRGSAKER